MTDPLAQRQWLPSLAYLIGSLDRCEHGRHQKDLCYSCQSAHDVLNAGNPHLDVVIGYDVGGTHPITPRLLLEAQRREQAT